MTHSPGVVCQPFLCPHISGPSTMELSPPWHIQVPAPLLGSELLENCMLAAEPQ
jgi:hypothetical protein